MKQHIGLGLILTAVSGLAVACGDDGADGSDMTSATASMTSSAPASDTAGPGVMPSVPSTPNTITPPVGTPTGTTTSEGGMGGAPTMPSAGLGGAGGMGGTCEIATLSAFARSDTDQSWDDNDFSDVLLEGTCPVLVNVTWPHEAGWQDADPSEANQEQTHFTLDSVYSTDLTGKQLNLTIELAGDLRAAEATTGGYLVSLVSVSTYDRIVPVVPPPPVAVDAGLMSDAGLLGDDGVTSDAGVVNDAGLVSDLGDASSEPGEPGEVAPMTMIETGYSETESVLEDRVILRHVGDRATITLPLPNKTAAVESYDPTRVIKINIRIYNMFTGAEDTGGTGAGGMSGAPASDAGAPGEADVSTDAGVLGDAGASIDSGAADAGAPGDAGTTDAVVALGDAAASGGAGGMSGAGGALGTGGAGGMSGTGGAGPVPTGSGRVYGYLTSQFAITNFTVTDVSAQ
jgi:hypothetical protein